jgi:serine/threonine protein kinase
MIGRTVSHYKILEKLGEGGMGVVYKALDSRLDREVAIKFLPPQLQSDPDAKARFIHEAKAASALNHSNIAVVHDIDESTDGQMFIVMAYYGGQTVRDKIKSGLVSVDEAIDVVSQIASGLAKAHEKDILHRDIKPANILLTEDGEAKLADFGLAKLRGQTKLTKTGTTVGTVSYMSPEQARGEEIDHRSDIFSLGVVLYELLTGELPFKGDHEAAVLYGIMRSDPKPLAECRDDLPDGLQHIVDNALAKNSETRYQSMADLLTDMKQKRKSDWEPAKPMDARPKVITPRTVIAALAVIAIIIVVVLLNMVGKQPAERIPATHRQITFSGSAFKPAISPDGKYMAWVDEDAENGPKVMVRDLTGGRALEVFSDYVSTLRWSPDGSELLTTTFIDSSWRTHLIPRLGGNARRIWAAGPTCGSPDGSTIASFSWWNQKHIWFTEKATGDTSSISLRKDFVWLLEIDWSPVGDRLLFRTEGGDDINAIWTIKTDGTQQQKVVVDSLALVSPRWSARGSVIYYFRTHGQTKDLMKVNVASKTGKAEGSPQLLQSGLQAGEHFTMSKDTKGLLYTRVSRYSNLWLAKIEGEGETQSVQKTELTTGTSHIHYPRISPDDKRIAFSVGAPRRANIFLMSIEGGEMQQLTFFNSYNAGACWSPDGKEIAFGSTEGGKPRIWKVDSNGGTPRPFESSELSGDSFWVAWAPGLDILYHRPGNRNFHVLNPKTEEERALVANDSVGRMFDLTTSPDGKSVAVLWNRKGRALDGIWRISLEDSSQTFLYRTGGDPIRWSADGKWIYVLDGLAAETKGAQIIKIPAAGGEPEALVTLPLENVYPASMTSDGRRIVCNVSETQSDVWLMENFDPEAD